MVFVIIIVAIIINRVGLLLCVRLCVCNSRTLRSGGVTLKYFSIYYDTDCHICYNKGLTLRPPRKMKLGNSVKVFNR